MTIRGNYHLLFGSQLITGLLTYWACTKYDVMGVIIGFIPFLIGMIVVLTKHKPDEREMLLSHQINSYEAISTGIIAGIIYFCFPHLNWFFTLVSAISVVRGIIGMIVFTVR